MSGTGYRKGQGARTIAGGALSGPGAQSRKYDLLTALGAHACGGDKHLQRLTLRLITLIVARYNWITDELAVGQREIAALWSLDERSVKRDFAKLKAMNWLICHRPAARGRVAVYGLGLAEILNATRPAWPRVGSDYLARMAGADPDAAPAPPSNVISFPAPAEDAGLWPRMQTQLFRDDPHQYGAWFAALRAEPPDDGVLVLLAPTRFHASYIQTNHLLSLTRLAASLDPAVVRVDVMTGV